MCFFENELYVCYPKSETDTIFEYFVCAVKLLEETFSDAVLKQGIKLRLV